MTNRQWAIGMGLLSAAGFFLSGWSIGDGAYVMACIIGATALVGLILAARNYGGAK